MEVEVGPVVGPAEVEVTGFGLEAAVERSWKGGCLVWVEVAVLGVPREGALGEDQQDPVGRAVGAPVFDFFVDPLGGGC